jgi:hypothetical protein
MTFGDLYGTLLDRELGSSDRTQLFTTARRKAAINEAQLEFVRVTEALTSQGTIALVDDTAEYDLETNFSAFLWVAADGVQVKKVLTATGAVIAWLAGDDLPMIRPVGLDRDDMGSWRSASAGTPMQAYVREDGGATYLGFTPTPNIPSTETWTAYVTYVAKPSDMSADADEPFTVSSNVKKTLAPWHQALVHFAASQLERLRRNPVSVQEQRQLFASYVADYLQRRRSQTRGPKVIRLAHDYRKAASAWRSTGVEVDQSHTIE